MVRIKDDNVSLPSPRISTSDGGDFRRPKYRSIKTVVVSGTVTSSFVVKFVLVLTTTCNGHLVPLISANTTLHYRQGNGICPSNMPRIVKGLQLQSSIGSIIDPEDGVA